METFPMSELTRRTFLTQTAPSAALAVATASTEHPPCSVAPSDDHSECWNHPTQTRLAVAVLGLQDALLDFLAAEDDLDEDTSGVVIDADHLLHTLYQFDIFLGGVYLGGGDCPVEARRLALYRKSVQRDLRHAEDEEARDYLQAEEMFYERARREIRASHLARKRAELNK
jgi:hypothetical protein